jgi:hypothetical protein
MSTLELDVARLDDDTVFEELLDESAETLRNPRLTVDPVRFPVGRVMLRVLAFPFHVAPVNWRLTCKLAEPGAA